MEKWFWNFKITFKKVLCFFLLPVFLLTFLIPIPSTEAASLSEYEIKAALLYQFTKFMEWPTSSSAASDAFTICFMGNNAYQSAFRQLDNEPVKQKPVKVQIVHDSADVESCQILFISRFAEDRAYHILKKVQSKSVLTVGETQGFLEKGGIISFVKDGHKIKFTVNHRIAQQVGIKISSKLLSVASQVIT